MDQPVPQVSEADVARIVARDFRTEEAAAVHAALAGYGTKAWQRETTRVRLAVLKLAHGDFQKLGAMLMTADQDYRDILSYAEYPGCFAKVSSTGADPKLRDSDIQSDWQQYRDWFERK